MDFNVHLHKHARLHIYIFIYVFIHECVCINIIKLLKLDYNDDTKRSFTLMR